MRESLDRIRMAKYLQMLVHTAIFWGSVSLIELVSPHGSFQFFSQYFILYCGLTLGIYAFRGFDMVRRRNFYHALISIFVGALAGRPRGHTRLYHFSATRSPNWKCTSFSG